GGKVNHSLHDALPIYGGGDRQDRELQGREQLAGQCGHRVESREDREDRGERDQGSVAHAEERESAHRFSQSRGSVNVARKSTSIDRKSTRLNSSHVKI